MRNVLFGFFLVTSPALAVDLKVVERYVPNFSQTGAIQVGPDGYSLNHGCEWFHFADLSTLSGSKPVKIAAKIRSSSGQTGFYFGLKANGYVTLRLYKTPGEKNTAIQLVKYDENGSSKNLASQLFKHNNNQWVSGMLEFEFIPAKSKILSVKFNGEDFTPQFLTANDMLANDTDALKGPFGSFCFVGYSHMSAMTIDGNNVVFN